MKKDYFQINDNTLVSRGCQATCEQEAPAKLCYRYVIWGRERGIYPNPFW
jgi:hypothetical protein